MAGCGQAVEVPENARLFAREFVETPVNQHKMPVTLREQARPDFDRKCMSR
jgi:hypothetical protein